MYTSLDIEKWFIGKDAYKNYSWFSIICDLMRTYKNVYADISYTLNDITLLPLLKMILEVDENIRKKVLFGTDFMW
jgi:predicted TIM-barrel fold metal-dependent hydrolase